MKIGIVALLHESNTFAAKRTSIDRFREDLLLSGESVRERLAGTHHEVGGFFAQLAEDRIEAVPIFAARATPSGTIERDTAATLIRGLDTALDSADEFDGLLVAPHGAAVAEGELDFDGFWLTRIRHRFGAKMPIVATLDLHANLSSRMVAATNAIISYRTNPHLDQEARGREAATLLIRTLRGEIRPTTAAGFPPLCANIETQNTAESPCRELISYTDEIRSRPGVLAVSLNLGFPYSDVPEMGSSLTVTTDGDPDLARKLADELTSYWWQNREAFRGKLISIADAVTLATRSPGPVCLLDMGDNVGGGSPADGTLIAHELLARGVFPAFVCLFDPDAVTAASQAGIGTRLQLTVGGKTDGLHGSPIELPCVVRGLFDGRFVETEARHGGIRQYDQGPTSIVESDRGLLVMLTSRRTAPFSLRQLTAFGIDPARFRVIIAKGVHAPVAAYAPVCPTLIRLNTPGITSADLMQLTFEHRRRPLFPFEGATD